MTAGDRPAGGAEDQARVIVALKSCVRPVLTGHVGMDGDALGSAMALWHALKAMGKAPLVVVNEAVPRIFAFLERESAVHVIQTPEEGRQSLEGADLLVVLDNNSWARLGHLEQAARASGIPMICIDHHPAVKPMVSDHLIDLGAASVGIMIHDLLEPLGVGLTTDIAEAIYTSVVNDTGWFRHANTDQRALSVSARLVAAGADPAHIDREINHRETLDRKSLLARFLPTLRRAADPRLATGHVTQTMLVATGSSSEDTEAFIEHVRTLEGVMIAGFLREEPSGAVKISLRTRPGFSALRVAQRFGGGGHVVAAGALHPGPLKEAHRDLDEAMQEELERGAAGEAPS